MAGRDDGVSADLADRLLKTSLPSRKTRHLPSIHATLNTFKKPSIAKISGFSKAC